MTTERTPAQARYLASLTWLNEVQDIVGRITYRPDTYRFIVEVDKADPGGRVYVQIEHDRPDAFTGEMGVGRGGKSYLSPHMTVSEIVRRCLGLALAYEEHEVREFFRYKGAQVFGPHIDVDALAEVAHRLDVRPPAEKPLTDAWSPQDVVHAWRRANAGCCERCGWHLSSHGSSHGEHSDCPSGVSPSGRDGSLAAMQTALRSIRGEVFR